MRIRSRPPVRFGLRTLFAGLTVFCIPLNWLGWNWNVVRERQTMRQEIEAAGAIFTLSMGDGTFFINLDRNPMPFPRNWMGDRRAAGICVPAAFSEETVAKIRNAFPEASVYAK